MEKMFDSNNSLPLTHSSSSIKVLLIEDNREDARLIAEFLSEVIDIPINLVCVDKLARGLEHLVKERADVILLDLFLPDSRGFDTFIKVHTEAPKIPVIVLTGLNDGALAAKAVRAGAQDYLIKGQIDSNLLVRSISYAIERNKMMAELEQIRQKQLRRLEEERSEIEERFALFMEHLSGGAWIKDTAGCYAYANKAALQKIFRKPLIELLGKSDEEIFPADTAKQFKENDSIVISTGQSLETVETIMLDDGSRYSIVNKFPIVNRDGLPVFVGGIAIDITERKQAEEALRKALLEVERLKSRLQEENVYLQEEIKTEHNFEEIVGESLSIKRLLRNVERVAHTDITVLIHGETGTGKELIARAIHNLSARKARPLVKVNCGAISPGLVESELFGHERGAFTGAVQQRIGRFELADRGTIFLDEVGELPLDTQVKLLRVLQEGEFERVGSSKPIKVDVRVIAATNRDLAEAVKSGAFRSDLYYRLNVFPIDVSPLREHKSDIPLLANLFLSRFARRLGKPFKGISQDAMNRLMSYSWPGNVRELQNVIERAVVISQEPEIYIDESTLGLNVGFQAQSSDTLEDMERDHIVRVLEQTNWMIHGKRGAATVLGINPSTLRSRMQRLGIKRPKQTTEPDPD